MSPDQYLALTLSGVLQASLSVDELAQGHRSAPPDALVAAIFSHNESEPQRMFGDLQTYESGRAAAIDLFRGTPSNRQAAAYAMQLLKLSDLLRKSSATQRKLRGLLDATANHQQDSARCAEIYQQTISQLGRRIQVTGNPEVLSQPEVAEHIRTSLLAGIRFAWLWRQLGGRQWQLLLRRSAIAASLKSLNLSNHHEA